MRISLFCITTMLLIGCYGLSTAQSTAFVPTGGLTFSNQKWDNNFTRDPLFKYHVALSIESVNNEEDLSSLFAQFGYHVKGSANRFRFRTVGGGFQTVTEEFLFNNLSLILGAKQKFDLVDESKFFFAGGIRGDYTLDTNLDDLRDNNPFSSIYYPQDAFVRKWIFGVSIGGGMEWMFGELVGAQLTFWFHPDITLQYDSPPIPNVIDPNNPGFNTTIPERRIRNNALEISLGLRLLRKVEYID